MYVYMFSSSSLSFFISLLTVFSCLLASPFFFYLQYTFYSQEALCDLENWKALESEYTHTLSESQEEIDALRVYIKRLETEKKSLPMYAHEIENKHCVLELAVEVMRKAEDNETRSSSEEDVQREKRLECAKDGEENMEMEEQKSVPIHIQTKFEGTHVDSTNLDGVEACESSLKREIEDLVCKCHALEAEKKSLTLTLTTTEQSLSMFLREKAIAFTQLREMEERVNEVNERECLLQQELADVRGELESSKWNACSYENQITTQSCELDSLRMQFEMGKSKDTKTITNLRKENVEFESSISDLKSDQKSLETSREEIKILLKTLQNKICTIDLGVKGTGLVENNEFGSPVRIMQSASDIYTRKIEGSDSLMNSATKLKAQATKCSEHLSAIKIKIRFQADELNTKNGHIETLQNDKESLFEEVTRLENDKIAQDDALISLQEMIHKISREN